MNRRSLAAGAAAVMLLAGACSDTDGDGDLDADPVAAAQDRLERAESALDEATVTFDDASAEFCGDSTALIEAVDRYAGVFTDAEATVGAVTDAGSDLEDPRDAVGSSAEEVGEARDDLAEAEAEVAAAEVALAEAQTGTSTSSESTTTTTVPLVPDDAVTRVEEAEEGLVDAFQGVDGSTPLSQATAEVNAAAVAVQVAWTQLFASAGCLSDEQHEEAVAAVGDYTRALQAALATAGLFDGEIDGVYGPSTISAVEQLQSDAGLPVTGLVDRATAEALDSAVEAAGGDVAAAEVAHIAALQTVLTVTGHWTGPVDGEWSDALTAALQELQTDLGVEPTGVVDPATIAAAQQALEEIQDSSTTTTTEEGDEEDEETTTTTTGT